MKIGEQFIDGEGTQFHVKQTFDPNPTLESVGELRELFGKQAGEKRHVGRVPGWLISHWLKEAGVRWDDIGARQDVIKRKMLSGDFAAFRTWEGTY